MSRIHLNASLCNIQTKDRGMCECVCLYFSTVVSLAVKKTVTLCALLKHTLFYTLHTLSCADTVKHSASMCTVSLGPSWWIIHHASWWIIHHASFYVFTYKGTTCMNNHLTLDFLSDLQAALWICCNKNTFPWPPFVLTRSVVPKLYLSHPLWWYFKLVPLDLLIFLFLRCNHMI